jgi:hypothetical protein
MAFVAPVVRTGPGDLGWWVYWLTHGGIVAAATYDVAVLGYRPRWADCRLVAGVTVVYAAFMAPLDGWLNANYGYVGDTARARESMVAAFGPWPGRVPLLAMTAIAMMAALTVPWELAARLVGRGHVVGAGSLRTPVETSAPATAADASYFKFARDFEFDDDDHVRRDVGGTPEPTARAA